jgi:hypothetical protein
MAEHASEDSLFGNAAVADDANLRNRLALLRPYRKDGEAKENEGQRLQREAELAARNLACLIWRAYALAYDGKNRHTLTAKNRIEIEEKAIISDRRRYSQLRNILGSPSSHRAKPIHPQLLTFQFGLDIKAITIPDDPENVWFAANLTIFDIRLPRAG